MQYHFEENSRLQVGIWTVVLGGMTLNMVISIRTMKARCERTIQQQVMARDLHERCFVFHLAPQGQVAVFR